MPVETRPTSRYWYGRWRRNGKRQSKRLRILVRGVPNDHEFTQSRDEAVAELARLVAEEDRTRRPEDLVQSLHEIKFGRRIGTIQLDDLADEWLALPRKRNLSKGRITFTKTVMNDFRGFVAENHPKVQEMAGVTPEIAEAFMASEAERGVSGRTYNARLSLLRGAFERLRVRAGMISNPFKERLVYRDENSQHRKPFTVDELKRLFDAAKPDREIHDLIVTGACTALRRGDACCLKWEDVDLTTNRIRIATRKTGEKVVIPIFSLLREALLERPRIGSAYVFPALANSYLREPGSINQRLNAAFARAGLRDAPPENPRAIVIENLPDEEEFRSSVMKRLKALTDDDASAKIRGMMIEIFDQYSSGMTLPDIAKEMEISKGSCSNYLARIEQFAGHSILRGEVRAAREGRHIASGTPAAPDALPAGKKQGLVRINTRGFHALRATFTTMALSAGVPVEVVRLLTGHTMTETVLKHYFNPREATVMRTVEAAMPRLLTSGRDEKPVKERMLEIINAATVRTWKSDLIRLKELVNKIAP